MSGQLQLNDQAAWDSLHPDQFVVFLSDSRNEVVVDEDGQPQVAER